MTNKSDSIKLSKTYWLVIFFEFIERGSYYGMMSILSIYLTETLGFTKEGVGMIKSTIQPLLYFLPIITGAIADKVGYRRTLTVAFAVMGLGYILTSQFDTYAAVFFSLIILAFGAGTFKPIISGTIAKETNEKSASLGFGIFYWSINLGAFLFPLIIVPALKSIDPSLVFLTGGIATGAMILPTIFFMKEPKREGEEINKKQPLKEIIKEIFNKIMLVLFDWRFILLIFIYSWFWVLYFQMFDSILWYFTTFIDATPLNEFISSIVGFNFKFDVEHITVVNAGTIILLQLFVSYIVKNTKALPTMIVGIGFAVIGMIIISLEQSIWIFILGSFVFSIGEMTAHPKYIAYLGSIAPLDKKGTYMGFSFLYGVFGSFMAGLLGAFLYVRIIDKPILNHVQMKLAEIGSSLPKGTDFNTAIEIAEKSGLNKAEILAVADTQQLWLIFSGIGVLCIVGLLLYNKFIGARKSSDFV